MDLQRIGIKLFASNPSAVAVLQFVPIFHSWIQKQSVPNHLLIDVHDYSHIQNGPGILLVAHEGNFSMDSGSGRLGLMYVRKELVDGTLEQRLLTSLKAAVHACRLIEGETPLRFKADEILLIANDRLAAPNELETVSSLLPSVRTVFKGFEASPVSDDPKERFAIRLHSTTARDLSKLAAD
jgi:hypothetical protein